MIKLVIFDLDDTLAECGKAAAPETLEQLRQIEELGIPVAICSGKPTFYLCGFARQLGLRQPILVGENGAVVQMGVDLPPKNFYIMPHSNLADESIRYIRSRIDEAIPDMWYQPNMVCLTPFPSRREDFDRIDAILKQGRGCIADVDIYPQKDCYDVVPANLDKGTGLAFVGSVLGISLGEMMAVGNGINDYPMFAAAGYSVGVCVPEPERVDAHFTSIGDAMEHILTRLRTQHC